MTASASLLRFDLFGLLSARLQRQEAREAADNLADRMERTGLSPSTAARFAEALPFEAEEAAAGPDDVPAFGDDCDDPDHRGCLICEFRAFQARRSDR